MDHTSLATTTVCRPCKRAAGHRARLRWDRPGAGVRPSAPSRLETLGEGAPCQAELGLDHLACAWLPRSCLHLEVGLGTWLSLSVFRLNVCNLFFKKKTFLPSLMCCCFSFPCRRVTCRRTYAGIPVRSRTSARSAGRGQCRAGAASPGSGVRSAPLEKQRCQQLWLRTGRVEARSTRGMQAEPCPPLGLPCDT